MSISFRGIIRVALSLIIFIVPAHWQGAAAQLVPESVASLSANAQQVAVGLAHTCALTSAGG